MAVCTLVQHHYGSVTFIPVQFKLSFVYPSLHERGTQQLASYAWHFAPGEEGIRQSSSLERRLKFQQRAVFVMLLKCSIGHRGV